VFDGARDLAPFTFSGQPGFVLNPHFNGNDLSQAGTIQGTLDLTAITQSTTTSGSLGIVVTAETLSADGTHHIIVASTPTDSSGNFVLYPLYTEASSSSTVTTSTNTPTSYDIVIHGPTIGTVIVKSIPVGLGNPQSGSSVTLPSIPVTTASSYSVNAASTVSPPGAWIGFYQTVPLAGEVPYVIEAAPIDPLTGMFDTAQSLSGASISFGTFSAINATGTSTSTDTTSTSTATDSTTGTTTTTPVSGTVTLTTVAPAEGAATYRVAASAAIYGDGPLTATVTAPASGTATATFTLSPLPMPSGLTAASVAGTVNVATAGKYDKGELILTQGGSLVAVTPLDSYLGTAQSSATLFSNVPGGTGSSPYYAEAWVWNSANPSSTLSRQPYSSSINLTGGSASGVAISIQ
jgi:hypothetical protein